MTSKLDYGIALLVGCPPSTLSKLQLLYPNVQLQEFLPGQENMII